MQYSQYDKPLLIGLYFLLPVGTEAATTNGSCNTGLENLRNEPPLELSALRGYQQSKGFPGIPFEWKPDYSGDRNTLSNDCKGWFCCATPWSLQGGGQSGCQMHWEGWLTMSIMKCAFEKKESQSFTKELGRHIGPEALMALPFHLKALSQTLQLFSG